jgi:predicted transcriptional regulator
MKLTFLTSVFLFFISGTNSSFDAGIGKTVTNVQLKSADDKPMSLPFFGQKVLAVFYNDPDAKDVNDPLSDAIKAQKFPKEKFAGIGVADCADTWLPNSVIRYAAREKEKKYTGSVVLIDEDRVLSKAWELGNCDDKGYIIVVGKDLKIKYIKQIKNQEESKAIIPAVLAILESEIAKVN